MSERNAAGIEKGRISSNQALAMIILVGLATTDILIPTVIATQSGRDAWITVLVSTAAAILIVGLAYYLGQRMGEKNLIQYAKASLGWAGWLVGLFYLTFLLGQAALTMRNFRTIMLTVFYIKTPDIVFELLVVVVVFFAVTSGLELVSRLTEILLPLGVALLAAVGILAARNLEFSEFLPVLNDGLGPVFSGTLRLVVYLAQGALVYLLLSPYINKDTGLLKVSLAVASLGPMMLVGVMAIGIFGAAETADMRFVALTLVRNINIGEFIQNLDALMMGIWYGGIIAKLCLLVYLACLVLSQWLGLRDYRPVVLPVLVILVAYAKMMFANPSHMVSFISQVEPGWNLTALLFIPLSMLGVILFKRK